MPKPTSLPRWGDVSGVIVEPSSGKKDAGWAVDERPPAQYMMWLQNLTYQWLAWLDPLLTSAGGFTALVNQSFEVSGTGKYKRPARRYSYAPEASGAKANVGSITYGSAGEVLPGAASDLIMIPVVGLSEGERITSVALSYTRSGGAAAGSIDLKLYRVRRTVGAAPAAATQIGSTANGTYASTNFAEVTVSSLTEDVTSVDCYFLQVEFTTNIPTAIHAVYITTSVV